MRSRSTLTVASFVAATLITYGISAPASATDVPAPTVESSQLSEQEVVPSNDGLEAILDDSELGESAAGFLDFLIKDNVDVTDGVAFGDGTVTTLPSEEDATTETVNLITGEALSIDVQGSSDAELEGDVSRLTGANGVETVVQATLAGAQILTTVTDPANALALTIETVVPEGTTWNEQADGGLVLADEHQNPSVIMGSPWAVDATGRALDTHFTIDGGLITQHVDTSAAIFPVVSDPDLWWYIGTSVVCAAEIASLAVVGAKVVAAFAKADRIIKAAKAVASAYKTLGGTVAKVVDLLKKYVKKKSSLTKKQITALENFIKGVGAAIFNIIGLGSCYSLFTEK